LPLLLAAIALPPGKLIEVGESCTSSGP
jgi:hypothetical protein